MKTTTNLLHGALWLMTAAKFAFSIKCFSCDSFGREGLTCVETLTSTDCSLDPEFGEEFDSCFTMIVHHENGTDKLLADCSMTSGCKALGRILCADFEEGRCSVECCMENLCNTIATSGRLSTYKLAPVSLAYKTSPIWCVYALAVVAGYGL